MICVEHCLELNAYLCVSDLGQLAKKKFFPFSLDLIGLLARIELSIFG